MDSYAVAIGSALWLGVLTSIAPCPLATNIAAITYVGRRLDRPDKVLLSGLLYTLGRMAAYAVIGALVVAGILAIPEVAMFLQRNPNRVLGPVLVAAGVLLLGLVDLRFPGFGAGERLQERVDRWGVWGAALLGMLFALAFCPVSAALFFGSLIPLALERESRVLMPILYGIGTALPVVVFALLIALGARFVGKLFDRLALFERWARRLTGVVFLVVGLYLVLIYLVD